MNPPLLSTDLTVRLGGHLVLDRVCIEVHEGEAVGVIGASGSGKSTLALAILNLAGYPRPAAPQGQVLFRGRNLLAMRERELRAIRGRDIALVLQSAVSALNPVMSIESHLKETWRSHSDLAWPIGRTRALDLLSALRLPHDDSFLRRFPGQISVGQAQRLLIAMALLHSPALLMADEPTSALDPPAARDALDSLRLANRGRHTALLLITHDVAIVPSVCGRVVVLDGGRVVEQGPCADIYSAPGHNATRRLLGQVCHQKSASAECIER